jgi:iron(II)-dependent oxidoreductase
MTQNAPTRLAQLREASLSMLDGLSSAEQRAQSHPELSPMLWHVGHVFFMETHWLAERVFGDSRVTDAWRDLYFPEISAKDERSARLPDAESLHAWAIEVSAHNDAYWRETANYDHPLLQDGYLAAFLSQHYAQHLETMRLARAQLALAGGLPVRPSGIAADAPDTPMRTVGSCAIAIGTNEIGAYDNEQPVFTAHLDAFGIAPRCVSNAQWLGFMQADGYARPELWDEAGWAWRVAHAIDHPQHWRAAAGDDWEIRADIDTDIASAPVHGIGWYEARAFARYAGARLPREVEWEAARRHGALADSEQVWQWCDDPFYPYPGFTAFPYDGYSRPWFDGAHFIARGASVHTEIDVRRPGLRNFYPPTHRHVFAGLRLARP